MQGIAFGPTIRLLRQAKGISLREMARRLGVSPAFLSQIEAGREHKIPKARIVQVAKMLGVSESYLLGTAHRIHPDVIEFLRRTPEAAEFMITAMKEGLLAEDFAELKEAVRSGSGKGPLRRAKVSMKGKRKKTAEPQEYSIDSVLEPSLCLAGITVQDKRRLLQRFVKLITKKYKTLSADELLESLEERERQTPTSVGGGVAIPHTFINGLENPAVGAFQLRRAVNFNPATHEKVRIVFFLIGDSNKPEKHLSTLARIARLCSDAQFLQAFGRARTNRELYKTIIQWDRRLGGT